MRTTSLTQHTRTTEHLPCLELVQGSNTKQKHFGHGRLAQGIQHITQCHPQAHIPTHEMKQALSVAVSSTESANEGQH